MKRIIFLLVLIAGQISCFAQPGGFDRKNMDWARYSFYQEANAAVTTAPKVVFMGDSITEFWAQFDPDFFTNNNFLGRGIGGQCAAHMLCRFVRDVVDLKPQVVVINAGTNDVARNNGYVAPENVVSQIKSMCDIAIANGIVPIVASILPCNKFYWNPEARPAQEIIELNALLKEYTDKAGIIYADYHTPMRMEDGSLPTEYSEDGCHPVIAGYKKMEEIIMPYIEMALKK